jgi:hypothetical protein
VVADSVEETILDLNAAKRDSLLQQRAGGGGGDDDAAARRWDVEGIERGVLSSLTDSLLSPRCSRSPEPPLETAAEPESEDL